jgi:type III pantothenate kinase
MDALTSRAAMLPNVELALPDHVLGLDTVTQIQAGVVTGYVGNMEHLIACVRREMGEPNARVVATGGLSRLIADSTDMIQIRDSQLILDGLRMLYEDHRAK